MFDFTDGSFDPRNEDVTITFGECPSCVELGMDELSDFVRDDDEGKFTATAGAKNAKTKVEIFDDGLFKVHWQGLDIDDIDLSFVSFMLHIGGRIQGVGLEFNSQGRCISANQPGGC